MADPAEIIVVSGLPRSGTSLMMQMLERGGIPALTDDKRLADTDNPRGYYELELVKKTKQDSGWLADARGKVVKMVSSLLYDLPASERYRIIFMQRELDEVIVSQEKMLQRRNQPVPAADEMKSAFLVHLERLHLWLARQSHMQLLLVSYNDLLSDATREVQRVRQFLGGVPDQQGMLNAIDPSLYRNRNVAVIAPRDEARSEI